jgi:hypothetical protein
MRRGESGGMCERERKKNEVWYKKHGDRGSFKECGNGDSAEEAT